MRISVITPVLNGVRFLRETIESVLSQTGNFELEYIIKDGGSIDGTVELIKKYEKHPSVTLVSKPDKSLYDAINQGFEVATGDIGCWINADDYFEPHTFQKVIEAFTKFPEKKWLYGKCSIVDEGGKEIRRGITKYKNIIGSTYSYQMLLCENYISQPSTFWKMDLWRLVAGLDERFSIAADYYLWLKFAQISRPVVHREKLANFRRCGESISDRQFVKQFQEELSAAKPFCSSLTYAIHKFNFWKIIIAYKIINRSKQKPV